jgi:hypothetical protein
VASSYKNTEVLDAIKGLRLRGLQTALLCHTWTEAGKSISQPEHMRAKQHVEHHFRLRAVRIRIPCKLWKLAEHVIDMPHSSSHLFESSKEKLHRRDPNLYARAAQVLGAKPREIIYVDARHAHLSPAAEIGMATVHCTSPHSAVRELEALLRIPRGGLSCDEVSKVCLRPAGAGCVGSPIVLSAAVGIRPSVSPRVWLASIVLLYFLSRGIVLVILGQF